MPPADAPGPRPYTFPEMRQQLLDHLQAVAHSATRDHRSSADAVDLAIFSILAMLDGVAGMPAFCLIPSPHPDDAAFCRDNGDNWWPDSGDIADGERQLHEMWAKKDWSADAR